MFSDCFTDHVSVLCLYVCPSPVLSTLKHRHSVPRAVSKAFCVEFPLSLDLIPDNDPNTGVTRARTETAIAFFG